jgi:hypothetical protein
MAYKQYTECIPASERSDMNRWIQFTAQSLLAGATGVAATIAAGEPWCLLIVAELTAIAFVIAYCRHFLYQRLICLGGDRSLVGMVVKVERPEGRPIYDLDTDFSVNLLLQNNPLGATQEQVAQSQPYGHLVAAHPDVSGIGLPTPGYYSTDDATGKPTAILHAEFEGSGIHDWLVASEIAFFVGVAALAACLVPWVGPVVGAIVAIVAALIWIIGTVIGRLSEGSPSDVPGAPATVHTNDDENGGLGAGADVLYMEGTWVFDPLHAGWNEIHPVKVCTKVGTWDGDWFTSVPDEPVVLRLREAFDDARSEETQANQQLPENGWSVHPDVDGCEPEPVIL